MIIAEPLIKFKIMKEEEGEEEECLSLAASPAWLAFGALKGFCGKFTAMESAVVA